MGIRFDALSKPEQLAVADDVRRQYESTASLQPETYVSRNAKAHPKRWQDGLRELVASDPKRVQIITEAARGESHADIRGFTLIELSIVLVVIGLIVGGVLVGQDLIRASEIRATVSQIEKYNTAVNTFRNKYNALPGDLNANTATAFGFPAPGPAPGQGDGNGIIEGSDSGHAEGFEQDGETLTFWVHLTVGNPSAPMNINMIDANGSSFSSPNAARVTITAANAANYFPAAKLGRGNYVYVYSTGGVNYFGIAPMTATTSYTDPLNASMSVQQAYQIDKKIDDGFPASGNVTATWDSGTSTYNSPAENAPAPPVNAAASDSATSCYNSSTTTGAYSISINNGADANCALSFRFQ